MVKKGKAVMALRKRHKKMPQEDNKPKAVFGRIPLRYRSWRPSKKQLIVVAVVAGLFGAYLIFRSFAADPASYKVNVMRDATSSFDSHLLAAKTNPTLQQWWRDHYDRMRGYQPYYTNNALKVWETPPSEFYKDLYAIYPNRTEDQQLMTDHPDWVLKDADGNKLWIKFACSGGKCTQYAADVGSPGWRQHWIDKAKAVIAQGYKGLYIDDVNPDMLVSDGNGNLVAPIDPRTGQPMTTANWTKYVAEFVEQVRSQVKATYPDTEITHNIGQWWFSKTDASHARIVKAADRVQLERGFNDGGLVGGTGKFGFETYMSHVDWLHSNTAGSSAAFLPYNLDRTSAEFELAAYFMVTNGKDRMVFQDTYKTNPDDWWHAWETDLGLPEGERYLWNGVFRRDYSKGSVLLNQPGATSKTLSIGSGFKNLDGAEVSSVILGARQGAVLLKTSSAPVPADDLLVSAERLQSLPSSGTAYDYMKQQADSAITNMNLTSSPDASSPWLPNFNGTTQVRRPATQVLGAALVYAKTGDTKYRDFVINANRYVIGTEDSSSNDGLTVEADKLLASVRQIAAYVMAADLVDMDKNLKGSRTGYTNTVWKDWLASLRTKSIGSSGGCPTMDYCSKERAHNWGTFARSAQVAIDIYLGDQTDLSVMVSRMKRYLGDTSQGAQWKPSQAFDSTWACVPSGSVWVAINPTDCGPEKDGAVVEDISRSAGNYPSYDNTGIGYTMEAYQSTLLTAILLDRQGYDIFNWNDQALRRTMDWLVREGYPQGAGNFSTDKHLSWIPRFFYKKDYPTQPAGMGRTFGFTDWLYGSVSLADTTSPTTSLTAPTNGSTVSGTVNISANASDNVGVNKVEFYRGSTKLGEDTSSPYSYSWNTATVSNGSYSLTAKAYDAAGNAGSSAAVTANVSNSTSGCTPSFGSFRVDTATLTPPPACWRPYNDTSPFNIGVGTSPKLLSSSGSIISRLAGFGTPQHLVAGTENTTSDYSHPIYYSKSTDPLYTIQCRKWVSSCSVHGLQVRIPAGAKPALGSDAHLDIVDQTGKWEYGFWETEPLPAGGGTLYIGHGGRAPIGTTDSSGLDNHATAAHFGLLGGIIRASEMSVGNINHALFMVVKCTNGTYVWPASGPGVGRTCASMGLSNADAPALGQHFYLDMTEPEINALAVPSWKKTILKAAAKYGMIVGDTGGSSWGLQFESSAGFTSFGHSDPLVSLAQSYGIAPYYDSSISKNVYVFNLRDGVDWANKLRVVDPCVAQKNCDPESDADTTAPTVSITSPSNGATVNGIVSVSASASDNVGVTKVDFSLDGTFKLSDTGSPYNYSFDSKTLANGSHTISAKAYDAAGNTKTASITVNVQNPDVTAPSPPSSLSGSTTQPTESTQSKVVLDWPVATDNPGGSGIKGYYVYRGNTVISPLITSGTTYTDNNVPAGSHTYTVRSVDNANLTSTTASPPYNTTVNSPPAPKDTTPPSTPLDLSAVSPKPSQVTLTWKASTDQGGSGLAGYNVYRNGSTTPLNGSNLIKSTSFGDGTVKPNSMYAYTVEAVDGAGNKSKMSPPVGVQTKTGKKSDVNGDDSVNIFDLSVMASNWGKTGATYAEGDLNGDGVVDIFDLSILASEWGS